MPNRLVQLELFPLTLPFRRKFTHAAASRAATDTVVCAALLADGAIGFGEGLPREYVTGESVDSVLYHIETTFAPLLKDLKPASMAELYARLDTLPAVDNQGSCINAARATVELALLDAYGKHFRSDLTDLPRWLGDAALTGPPSIDTIRVSGVLSGSDPNKTVRQLRLLRLLGLRDFKLKLGYPHDFENLRRINDVLGEALARGQMRLRVDANAAWDVDTAVEVARLLPTLHVHCLEQPLAAAERGHLRTLANLAHVSIMADESLLTLDDAEYLLRNDLVDFFNIRISKNGGLIPSIKMAALAARQEASYGLGAMVGESAILASAGRKFLQLVPNVEFTEICYSTFLLRKDLSARSVRFGWSGKLRPASGHGLGVIIKSRLLNKFLSTPPRKIGFG